MAVLVRGEQGGDKAMIYHFPTDLLPPRFEYPTDFLEFSAGSSQDLLEPWFLMSEKKVPHYWRDELPKKYSYGSDLVIFSKYGHDLILSCFASSGRYPDVKVVVIDADNVEGTEVLNEFESFSEWLAWTRRGDRPASTYYCFDDD